MPDAAYCNAKNDIEASVNPQEGSHPPAGFAGDFAIKAFVRTGCKLPSISLMRRAFTPFLRNIESSVVVPKPIIMPATPKSGLPPFAFRTLFSHSYSLSLSLSLSLLPSFSLSLSLGFSGSIVSVIRFIIIASSSYFCRFRRILRCFASSNVSTKSAAKSRREMRLGENQKSY